MSVKIQNPDRLLACPFFFRWTMKVVEREALSTWTFIWGYSLVEKCVNDYSDTS